ncbi:MATE family efflux transporter [Leucobacter komagatae]|uniref:MATE family efflux transporter n=1 Tax=Leucobacter komagatae TaxID=55969 RepID=UPI000A05F6E5|nr:MATE family efflux transporter [Leucobacter komagatae]
MLRDQLSYSSLFRYAGPAALASVGSIVVSITDTVIVGYYSSEALAGVAFGSALYELPLNCLLGGLMAYRILAPRVAGNYPGTRPTGGIVLMLRGLLPWAVLASILLFGAAILLRSSGFFDAFQASQASSQYVAGRAWSILPEIATTAIVVTLVTWGRTKTPLIVLLVASAVNLVLDYFLVYGVWVFPELGAFGAGLAGTIGMFAVVPVVLAVLLKEKAAETDHVEQQTVLAQFSGWTRLTLPAVGSAAVDYAGNLVFFAIVSLGGVSGLAATRIASNAHLLAFVLASSLSSALLYVVGGGDISVAQSRNARLELRRKFLRIGMLLGGGIAILAWPVSFAASPDQEVRRFSLVLVLVVAAMCPVITWAYVNVSFLRAMERTGSDFLSNTAGVWGAQIPVAYVGLLMFQAPGAFLGLAAYWLCRGAIASFQVKLALQIEADRD